MLALVRYAALTRCCGASMQTTTGPLNSIGDPSRRLWNAGIRIASRKRPTVAVDRRLPLAIPGNVLGSPSGAMGKTSSVRDVEKN